MRNGMGKDFSWNASAKEYVRIFERVKKGGAPSASKPPAAPAPVLEEVTAPA